MPYTIPEYIEIKATDGSTVAFLSPESDGVEAWIDDEQNGICTLEMELPLNEEIRSYQTGVQWQTEIAQTIGGDSDTLGMPHKLVAQGFTATNNMDGAVKVRASFFVDDIRDRPDTKWYIYGDNNGEPGESICEPGTILGSSYVISQWSTVEIILNSPLQSGGKYWLVGQGQGDSQYGVEWGCINGNPYPGGYNCTSNDSGSTWTSYPDYDSAFKIEVEVPVYETMPKSPWQYLTDQYRIYADDKEFVILNPDAVDKQRDGQRLTGKIKAHESWVLLGKRYQTISNDPQNPSPPWGAVIIVSGGAAHGGFEAGSAGSALSYLLNGTGWTVGTVDVTGTYDLETEKESVLYNINQVQGKWGGILIWDSVNKTVSLRDEETYQPYTGYQIRYAKNLKGISRVDDYDIVTRLYPFGENDLNIANVNGGLLYLDNQSYSTEVLEGVWYNQDLADQTQLKTQAEKQLAVMCKPRHNYKTEVLDLRSLPGYGHETFKRSDMADLFDEEFGANARVRIIRYRHNVFQPWLCDMELGDPLEKIAASVAQTVLMAKFYKNVVAPNTSFQNLLKAIINTEATEINGANGDYTLVDGVSTWKDPDTGDLTRATPKGLIISSDGGQTWKTAISGKGIHADAGWIGKLNAGVVTIGAETTFADGYDPTQITADSVGMGVDSDCLGLWHFDGSLNSHKGITAITALDPIFDAGCFGSALAPLGEASPTWTNVVGCSVGSDNSLTKTAATTAWDAGAISTQSITGDGYVTTVASEINTNRMIGLGNANVDASFYDIEFAIYLMADGTLQVYESGTPKWAGDTTYATGDVLKVAVESGVVKYYKNSTLLYTSAMTPTFPLYVDTSLLTQGATLKQVQLYGQTQVLKVPTTGMLASVGTINFRAKNLSASANGAVLIDLPKSDNTQGLQAGISSATGHEGEIFITTLDSDFSGSKTYSADSIWDATFSADKAFDNNETTRWATQQAGSFPHWVKVDLGVGVTKIARKLRLNIFVYNNKANVKDFKLQGSNDDSDWTDVYTGLAENKEGWQEFIFNNDNSYRYYRVYITSSYRDDDADNTASIFEIEMMEATTVYGPNKSTLTGWDSISLAWKPERLSLVVNDEEACFIENPGLPASLGSHIYIGTDRNGVNAINTLVDELRIDKVYKEVATRTAWHKVGSPFYTSEEMKQWPGYLKAETDGLKVYDSSNVLRLLIGSWLKDAVRKYGIKIIDGEIYSSIIRSGAEDATTYIQLIPPSILQVVKDGKQLLRIDTTAEHGLIDIFNAEGLDCGRLGGANDRDLALTNVRGKIFIVGQTGVDCMYGINVTGGVKNCIEDTIYGKLGISARESPEVRYIDEGMGTLVNGECRIDIDPIFMECIEPHMPDSRWYVNITPYGKAILYVDEIGDDYFIVKDYNDNANGIEFTWSLSATRKDYAMIRFMEVLD